MRCYRNIDFLIRRGRADVDAGGASVWPSLAQGLRAGWIGRTMTSKSRDLAIGVRNGSGRLPWGSLPLTLALNSRLPSSILAVQLRWWGEVLEHLGHRAEDEHHHSLRAGIRRVPIGERNTASMRGWQSIRWRLGPPPRLERFGFLHGCEPDAERSARAQQPQDSGRCAAPVRCLA